MTLLVIILVPLIGMGIWVGVTLGYTYSEGTRTGYVQKLSHKGWTCKTWEGELAMTTVPGTVERMISQFIWTMKSIVSASFVAANSIVTWGPASIAQVISLRIVA